MNLPDAIRQVARGEHLSHEEMGDVMRIIMSGDATPAQIGAVLTALHIKGETVEELTGAATVMREFAARVNVKAEQVADSVGTGGDGASLFNVSTASALVACAAGAVMAKHGNRAATGKSGSADALEAAGVNITLSPEQVAQTIDAVGIGFMFAPTHHGATRHAVGPRREIGVRTLFNLLGPLTNPAGARWQLVGVFDKAWVHPLAEAFANLGSVHTLVVCSDDGLDEISIAADTHVSELRDGGIEDYVITPEQFGISRQPLDALVVGNAEESFQMIQSVLDGESGLASDMVVLNAGATIYAADLADSLESGIERAQEILKSKAGQAKLEELAAYTQQFAGQD
jgi:anthranilate phosphoribosyltransferase